MKITKFFFLFIFIFCSCEKKSEDLILKFIAEIESKYAPDSRISLWEVNFSSFDNTIFGETNLPEAKLELLELINSNNIYVRDSIDVLPDLSIKNYGVVNNAVSNLRKLPNHSSEMVSQAVLGTKLKVLKKKGEWYLVQTPEGYISWIDHGGFKIMDKNEFDNYFEAESIIYKDVFGFSYKSSIQNSVISDLVMGSVLKLIDENSNYYEVMYPDGRIAWVKKSESMKYSSFISLEKNDTEKLIMNAKKLLGIPYLWGGTSSKGFDCSGLTKTLYFMNGLVIPRDASQQINIGYTVDSLRNWENLEKGDLLFFGYDKKGKTKIDHVALWLGNEKFIQSSKNVRINSVNPQNKDYDSYHLDKYVMTRRILRYPYNNLIELNE